MPGLAFHCRNIQWNKFSSMHAIKVAVGFMQAINSTLSLSLTLHTPSQVDPLVSLMMVEKVPDSTYDMVGGLDKQIKEIKEVGVADSLYHNELSHVLTILFITGHRAASEAS